MNQITTVPDTVSSAGYTFNYALWTAGTVVTLVNVTWDAEYRNIVKFRDRAGIDNWIDNRTDKLIVRQMKHMRFDQPIRISAPFERVAQYNYVRATNPSQPVEGSLPSTYYYFIRDVRYIAPNTTEIVVQLDVWTTFNFDIQFSRAFVERGHIGIANENQGQWNGRDYLTVPEGLDMGGEMQIYQTWKNEHASAQRFTGDEATKELNYSVMVTSTVDLEADPGDESNPKLRTATGSSLENLPNGSSIYIFDTLAHFQDFLRINKDKAWVTTGIISIMAVPPVTKLQVGTVAADIGGVPAGSVRKPASGSIVDSISKVTLTDDWVAETYMPPRYKNLKKFNVYPYAVIEMTTYTGQPLVLKPESFPDKKLEVRWLTHLNPGSARISCFPLRYNAAPWANKPENTDEGEFLDMATTISNFPQFTTVNNNAAGFLASNRNSIAFQQSSAMWDQQRALQGASTAYNQATSAMQMTSDMNSIGIEQRNQSTAQANSTRAMQGYVQMGQGAVGALGALAGGNPVGAALNAVSSVGGAYANSAIDQNQNTQQNSINNAAAQAQTNANLRNAGYQRDTNQQYAQYAAQGDYANAIAGIQAKVQDAKLIQPSTSGQIGGDSFMLAKVGWSVFLKLKRINEGAMREIGEYWLRYGYRVNRWVNMPAYLLVCEKFTYWQLKDANMFSGSCPELYRQTVRGIFEKGVTVWANPDEIGRIDPADNAPLEGFKI